MPTLAGSRPDAPASTPVRFTSELPLRSRRFAVGFLRDAIRLDRLLRELGHEASVVSIAGWYASLASVLVLDEVDAALAGEVELAGPRAAVAPTIMSTPVAAAALARRCLDEVLG